MTSFLNWKQLHPDQSFEVERVNNIKLCNEEHLKYDCYYLNIETDVTADWSSLDTSDALLLIHDSALVTGAVMTADDIFS